jgi:GH24 family phage-related lysozyme (muramidase)
MELPKHIPCLLRFAQSFFGFQQSSLPGSAGVATVGRGFTLEAFQSTVLVETDSAAQLLDELCNDVMW